MLLNHFWAILKSIEILPRAAQPDAVATFAKACRVPGGVLGMPVYRGSGSHTFNGERYRFLVMDRFGKDLQGSFESGMNPFSCQVAFTLAVQVIHVLEYIHSHGYAHNDVKAQGRYSVMSSVSLYCYEIVKLTYLLQRKV